MSCIVFRFLLSFLVAKGLPCRIQTSVSTIWSTQHPLLSPELFLTKWPECKTDTHYGLEHKKEGNYHVAHLKIVHLYPFEWSRSAYIVNVLNAGEKGSQAPIVESSEKNSVT